MATHWVSALRVLLCHKSAGADANLLKERLKKQQCLIPAEQSRAKYSKPWFEVECVFFQFVNLQLNCVSRTGPADVMKRQLSSWGDAQNAFWGENGTGAGLFLSQSVSEIPNDASSPEAKHFLPPPHFSLTFSGSLSHISLFQCVLTWDVITLCVVFCSAPEWLLPVALYIVFASERRMFPVSKCFFGAEASTRLLQSPPPLAHPDRVEISLNWSHTPISLCAAAPKAPSEKVSEVLNSFSDLPHVSLMKSAEWQPLPGQELTKIRAAVWRDKSVF